MVQDSTVPLPEKKSKVRLTAVFAWTGIFLIAAMAVSIALMASDYQPLKASVEYNDKIFVFKNDDDFDWNDVRFLLNTDYKYNVPTIAAHSEFSADGANFAKDDGAKFDPSYMVPNDFIVTAKITDLQWSSWFYVFLK